MIYVHMCSYSKWDASCVNRSLSSDFFAFWKSTGNIKLTKIEKLRECSKTVVIHHGHEEDDITCNISCF
jgi:hypothetical protein